MVKTHHKNGFFRNISSQNLEMLNSSVQEINTRTEVCFDDVLSKDLLYPIFTLELGMINKVTKFVSVLGIIDCNEYLLHYYNKNHIQGKAQIEPDENIITLNNEEELITYFNQSVSNNFMHFLDEQLISFKAFKTEIYYNKLDQKLTSHTTKNNIIKL